MCLTCVAGTTDSNADLSSYSADYVEASPLARVQANRALSAADGGSDPEAGLVVKSNVSMSRVAKTEKLCVAPTIIESGHDMAVHFNAALIQLPRFCPVTDEDFINAKSAF